MHPKPCALLAPRPPPTAQAQPLLPVFAFVAPPCEVAPPRGPLLPPGVRTAAGNFGNTAKLFGSNASPVADTCTRMMFSPIPVNFTHLPPA